MLCYCVTPWAFHTTYCWYSLEPYQEHEEGGLSEICVSSNDKNKYNIFFSSEEKIIHFFI